MTRPLGAILSPLRRRVPELSVGPLGSVAFTRHCSYHIFCLLPQRQVLVDAFDAVVMDERGYVRSATRLTSPPERRG